MGLKRKVLVLSACFALLLSACGPARDDPAQFQSGFDEAVKAAEKGKELVKSPAQKGKKR